ncbi:MAG: DPP IV N-terminal domain-containing protein, partial [Vicinamibacteria bacterium]
MIDERFEWKRWIVRPFLFVIWCAAGLSAAERELTIDRITSLPALTGTPPARPAWSRTSDRVAFLWNDRGHPFLDVWTVSISGGDPIRVTDLNRGANEPESRAADSDPLADLTRAFRERTRSGVSEVTWTPGGEELIFSFDGHLHRVGAGGGGAEPITPSTASRSSLAYSPDGRFLSWLQAGDLWLWRDGESEPVRATKVGLPGIGFIPGARYNRLDRAVASYQWSPDSRYVALEVDDLRSVRKEAIPNYIGPETEVRHLRRAYPGDHHQVRAIEIYSVESGRLATVPLEDPTYRLINSYSWSPAASSRLLIDQVSEDAVDRWFWLVAAEDVEVEELWHDRRETRNSARLTTSLWRSDGAAVLFTADLDGRHRLHSLSIEDGTLRTLTAGDWSVVAPAFGGAWVAVSPRTKEVFFVSTKKDPYERQVYRMPEAGGTVTQVTTIPGVHEATLSPDGTRLALLHSNDTTPRELYLHDADSGAAERRVTQSPPAEFREYDWVEAR